MERKKTEKPHLVTSMEKNMLKLKRNYNCRRLKLIKICIKCILKEWLYRWLEEIVMPNVKYSTYIIYRYQMEHYVLDILGQYKLSEIDDVCMEYFYTHLHNKTESENMIRLVCQRLRSALFCAKDRHLIAYIPRMPFRRNSNTKICPRYLNRSEQKSLEQALDLSKRKDLAIYFSLYTGIRIGECCALKWKDIDVEEQNVYIHSTLSRIKVCDKKHKTEIFYMDTKTPYSRRYIPLTHTLLEFILLYKSSCNVTGEDFVFGKGAKAIEPRNLQYYVKTLGIKNNISDIHFHTLRHTFATRCIEQGIEPKSLSELLGHSSVKITLDWYCHSSDEQKRKMIERLENYSKTNRPS